MMKISISTYSFAPLMADGKMTQLDCVAKAKEMGFDAIEFVDVLPHDNSDVYTYAKKLKEEADRAQLPVSNFTFSADFLKNDTQAEIARVKSMIDLAEAVGAKSVRHDASSGADAYPSFALALPHLAKACREVTEYAAAKGIRTMVENHGFFCQDSERVVSLYNAVAHPNFGLLADMGNFLCADEDPALAISRVAPLAFYAHAKDFHIKSGMLPSPGRGYFRSRSGNFLRGSIIGHGNVPVLQCLSALKQAGYDGYIAIEFEGMEDPMTGIEIGLENLKRYISSLEN